MLRGVQLGFLIGAIPTLSMVFFSVALSQFNVPSSIEACFQNFAAGLILAAVAAELFPLMLTTATPTESMIGISVGFVAGLTLIYGLDFLIGYIEESTDEPTALVKNNEVISKPIGLLEENNQDLPKDGEKRTLDEGSIKGSLKVAEKSNDGPVVPSVPGPWALEPVELSTQAFQSEIHRNHIGEHLLEISHLVSTIELESNKLMEDKFLTQLEMDNLTESIDESIHSLQHKVDHCKRLVQGAESVLAVTQPRRQLSDEGKVHMAQRLRNLKFTSNHIIDHMHDAVSDVNLMKEIHTHMEEMDLQIAKIHHSVEKVGSRWRRIRALPVPVLGDKLPVGLVIPVTVDCFVDGFLIGVSCALSPPAGIILGAANCLEMGFLGMAFSTRITKCTGSSISARNLALYCPPLVMFLSAGLGAFVGDAARSVPAVFVGFVSFGTVALLFLVCNELLIEAKLAQGDDERWWISIMVFAGVYLVLMIAAGRAF